MTLMTLSTLTICGLDELPGHETGGVTHVLSVLDPEWPEIESFSRFGPHHRTTLYFHDIIEPLPGKIAPEPADVDAIVRFGEDVAREYGEAADAHLLVHCHMGISRSTAAMESEARLFERLRQIRPQAWPNSRMIAFADEALGRKGGLSRELSRHYAWALERQPKFSEWMSHLGRGRELEMAAARI